MSAFVLKIVASICMLIDHTAAALGGALIFRSIGRIAFPIYAYMIAQGYKHTKNVGKYLLRLGVFAMISEIPFDIAFKSYKIDGEIVPQISFLSNTNVFYTLFLGVLCIWVYEKVKAKKNPAFVLLPLAVMPIASVIAITAQNVLIPKLAIGIGLLVCYTAIILLCFKLPNAGIANTVTVSKKVIAFICAIPMMFVASVLSTDYGMWGVFFIFFFYLMKPEKRALRTIATVIVATILYGYPLLTAVLVDNGIYILQLPATAASANIYGVANFCFALVAALFVWLYNGKQGKKLKWAFYAFYPVHIAILALIMYLAV